MVRLSPRRRKRPRRRFWAFRSYCMSKRRVVAGDDVGHGERLAAAGDAQQRLVLLAAAQPFDQLFDGGGLVTGHLVVGDEAELGGGGGRWDCSGGGGGHDGGVR